MPGNEPFSKKHNLTHGLTFFLTLSFLVLLFAGDGFARRDSLEDTPTTVDSVSEDDLATVKAIEEEMIKSESVSKYDVPLNSVTVIGTRLPSFKVPFSDIPANVSYIPANVSNKDREEIYGPQPATFQQSVKDLEGTVFFDEVGNGVDKTFSLRGFNSSSGVIFLLDGVRVNDIDGDNVAFPLIDMSDIDALQIDRGSASPIFGSNSFAGVVHITTGRPSEKPLSLFGGAEYSSFDGMRFHQGLSGTLQDSLTGLDGDFTYYFRGGRTDSDGFRPNGDYRLTNFDMKFGYELPDEQGGVNFKLKHTEGYVANPGALTFDQFQANDDQTIKPLDGRDRDNTIIQIGADKKFLDDHVHVSILGSQRYNKTEFTTTFATFSAFGEPAPDTDILSKKSRASDLIWQVAVQEDFGKLNSQTTLGMEMRDSDELGINQDAPGGVPAHSLAVNVDRFGRPKSVGLFWREALNYNNVVIAHVGMRHDWHWLKVVDNINAGNNLSARWNESTVSTGVTVRPVEAVDIFVNYSQGFRVPALSELFTLSSFGPGISQGLDPVTSDSYEIGTRVRVKDKANLKASFFVIDLEDEIVFDSNSRTALAPFGQNINATESRRIGVETRIDAQPIDEVKVYGSYTWTQSLIRKTDSPQPFSGIPSLAADRSLGQAPEHRLTFGAVAKPLQRLGEGFEGLEVGLHGVFTGKQHPTNYESASQAVLNATGGAGHYIKSYTIWDFILSYDWKGNEIYFKINNLFDNKYYSRAVNATSFGGGLVPAGTFTFVNPGAPREFILGSRWQFDSLTDLLTKRSSSPASA